MSKYKIIQIGIFLIMILSISKVYAITFGYSLMGKIVFLDPGHGGL